MGLTTAEQMVELLKAAGIRRIYGITGDSLNFLNDALRRDGTIEWIHVRHEEAGAFAAMAEGVLGGLGCCAGSAGPGHVHLLNGLYDAHRWGAPVLALASTIISDNYGSESFQATDLSIFDGCSYYNELAQTPKQISRMTQQALQHAWTNKGVGVIAFPGDLMMQKAYEQIPLATLYRPSPVIRPSDSELRQLASLINNSDTVSIYAGIGSMNARPQVLELAKKLNAPIAYTLKAKMTFEYDNPYAVGMTGLLGSSAGARAVTQSKLLLMLGSDFPWREFLDGEVNIVQIDTKPERLGRRVALHTGLTGDIAPTLNALLPLIESKTEDHFLQTCLKDYETVLKNQHHHAHDQGENNLIKPEFLAAILDKLANEDAIFTADTGMCAVWVARYIHGTGKRSLMGSFSHGSMANAMPQAIGAALHSPHRQVIALCGDGGISMLLGDLMTIAQYKLPIKLIIFNNRVLGMVELEMQVAGLPDWQTKMANPNFVQVAEACGIRGYSIHKPEQLESTLQEALSYEGAVLVEVFTNPDVPVLPPHTSVGVLSHYIESQAKLTAKGRFEDAWLSLKTSMQYIRDLW
ncbi:thiamine pyrophosphate-dependent enzyme [Legionella sp.]|uniref:thiamine pyrophosphate-dependent enzyme n=1 Tax=Legionella sp. TaxID=459 RepID=UPI003CAFC9D3